MNLISSADSRMEVITMKLSKRESILVTTALAAVAVFIYHYYILTPAIDTYTGIREEIGRNQKHLRSLQTAETELADLLESIEKDKREIARLEEAVPSGKKLPEVIVQLENLSLETGIELKEIFFASSGEDRSIKGKAMDTSEQHQDYIEIPVELKLTGSYGKVLDFIEGIENSKRLYSIRSITFIREHETDGADIGVDLELYAYAIWNDGFALKGPGTPAYTEESGVRDNPFKPLSRQ